MNTTENIVTTRSSDLEILDYMEENVNEAISIMFKKHRGSIHLCQQIAFALDDFDKHSIAIEELYSCMLKYSEENVAVFNTYLVRCMKNRFINENKFVQAKTKNRDWYYNFSELGKDGEAETSHLKAGTTTDIHTFEFLDTKLIAGLTDIQYRYLQLALEDNYGKLTNAEAARELGVSRGYITQVKKQLQELFTHYKVFQ